MFHFHPKATWKHCVDIVYDTYGLTTTVQEDRGWWDRLEGDGITNDDDDMASEAKAKGKAQQHSITQ